MQLSTLVYTIHCKLMSVHTTQNRAVYLGVDPIVCGGLVQADKVVCVIPVAAGPGPGGGVYMRQGVKENIVGSYMRKVPQVKVIGPIWCKKIWK